MTYIFQDSLSGDVLGVWNGSEAPEDIREGNTIDLSSFTGSSESEKVLIQSVKEPREGFKQPQAKLISVKPSSYKGVSPANNMFQTVKGHGFIYKLEDIVIDRNANPSESSFTSSLLLRGTNIISSSLVNQVMESILEAKDSKKQSFSERAADVLYHYIVLLVSMGVSLSDIEDILLKRHRKLHIDNAPYAP